MSPRQKCRHRVAKYIYDGLRKLDAGERGSKAFGWFETTGSRGDPANRLHDLIRMWKFVPRAYQIDRGWSNKLLDEEGRYVSASLEPRVVIKDFEDQLA